MKKVNKRFKSSKKYIDELQKIYSKLIIVRIDLGYKKPYSAIITLEEASQDLNRMLNNMRSKPSIFKHKVGYIYKKEYTEDKGIHIHVVFIYDGNKVQKDVFKGDQIGQYWQELTAGKGSFHNCNRNSYIRNGVGMLHYNDIDKREILDADVISYLCKDDLNQDLEQLTKNKKDKAFARGIIPKCKVNIGRPRICS